MVRIPLRRLRTAVDIITGQLYTVAGDSMTPSFKPRDCLLVSSVASGKASPARGDAVIVRAPGVSGERYLKRIVGLPGEEVRLSEGMLYIDGNHLYEPYLGGLPASVGLDDKVWMLGESDYFVLGDNRAHSTDSRDFGPISPELIIGKVWFRIWPPNRWGAI